MKAAKLIFSFFAALVALQVVYPWRIYYGEFLFSWATTLASYVILAAVMAGLGALAHASGRSTTWRQARRIHFMPSSLPPPAHRDDGASSCSVVRFTAPPQVNRDELSAARRGATALRP